LNPVQAFPRLPVQRHPAGCQPAGMGPLTPSTSAAPLLLLLLPSLQPTPPPTLHACLTGCASSCRRTPFPLSCLRTSWPRCAASSPSAFFYRP